MSIEDEYKKIRDLLGDKFSPELIISTPRIIEALRHEFDSRLIQPNRYETFLGHPVIVSEHVPDDAIIMVPQRPIDFRLSEITYGDYKPYIARFTLPAEEPAPETFVLEGWQVALALWILLAILTVVLL